MGEPSDVASDLCPEDDPRRGRAARAERIIYHWAPSPETERETAVS